MADQTITMACPHCQSTEIEFDTEDRGADHTTRRYRVEPVQCPSCDIYVSLAVRGMIYGDIGPVHTL